jgi:hypothetical protein
MNRPSASDADLRAAADRRSDTRTLIIGVSVMLALVVFGIGFAARFAATACRALESGALTLPAATAGSDVAGVRPSDLVALEALLGPVASVRAVPLGLRTLADHAEGVLLLGEGVVLITADDQVLAAGGFGADVEVVGSGPAVFATVIGNTITGQVDALRALSLSRSGLAPSGCVDTSAVGSPLAFLLDAADGVLVGLRTDEDGSDVVLELRDPFVGRVWATPLESSVAPAGLQGARTSGALDAQRVVVTQRIAGAGSAASPTGGARGESAVSVFDRAGGTLLLSVEADALRAVLPSDVSTAAALRIEVVRLADDMAWLEVTPDVGADQRLLEPAHGPLVARVRARSGDAEPVDPARARAIVTLGLVDGELQRITGGVPDGREDAATAALRVALVERVPGLRSVWIGSDAVWVLGEGVLLRFAGQGV